jgi:hypothetical protein
MFVTVLMDVVGSTFEHKNTEVKYVQGHIISERHHTIRIMRLSAEGVCHMLPVTVRE